jgi:hypothetical protein
MVLLAQAALGGYSVSDPIPEGRGFPAQRRPKAGRFPSARCPVQAGLHGSVLRPVPGLSTGLAWRLNTVAPRRECPKAFLPCIL